MLSGVNEGPMTTLPGKRTRCTLPFPVWLALSKATPLRREGDELQTRLGEDPSQSQELV